MTIETNKYDIEQNNLKVNTGKTLPDTFEEASFLQNFIIASVFAHILFALSIMLLSFVFMLLGIKNPLANKPELESKDIEFVLTQEEKEPINKNTKYRSDKNSQAGGIHDPNKVVSLPVSSPAPSPAPAPQPKPVVQQKPQPKPIKTPPVQTPTPKPAMQPAKQAPKPVQKPSKPLAPQQKPVLKPSASVPKPSMPKLVTAPSSPFKVAVPNINQPAGKGFSTSSGTSSSGGSQGSQGSSSKGIAGGMPAPQFSTTRTASSSSGSSSRTGSGQGGYSSGNMGNPGPGNPSGAPGVDAIKSPQWGPYMRELESKIKRNWHPPKGDQSKRVVLLFKIGRRGDLLSVRVLKPSGSQSNDQAAITAVQMSAPFRALPPQFTGSNVEIEFTFDYNVLGASYR